MKAPSLCSAAGLRVLALASLLGLPAVPASASVFVPKPVPVLWEVIFSPAPCDPATTGSGCATPYQSMIGAFGLRSSLSGVALSIDLGEIDGESSDKGHKGEVELLVGETLRFSFQGQWTSPPMSPGGPVPIPYPNIFAFAADVDPQGLTPPDDGAPQIDIGQIGSRDFVPLESAGRLFAFDAAGGVTAVGTWASRLSPAPVPSPGTLALLVVGLSVVLASRRSARPAEPSQRTPLLAGL